MKILKRIISIMFIVISIVIIWIGIAEIFDKSPKAYPNYPFGSNFGFWYKDVKTYMMSGYVYLALSGMALYGGIKLWFKGWKNLFFVLPLIICIVYMLYEASSF